MLDAWLVGRGLVELGREDDQIRAVTQADVRRLTRYYFDPNRVVEGVVRGSAGGDR